MDAKGSIEPVEEECVIDGAEDGTKIEGDENCRRALVDGVEDTIKGQQERGFCGVVIPVGGLERVKVC